MTPLTGRWRRCALAIAAALPLPASAGFFIPRDVTMFMFSASPDSQMADIAYGVRADLALSAGQSRYRSDDGHIDRRYSTLQANWLIHRDYGADGITNLYLFGGPLLARSSEFAGSGDDTRAGLHGGYWADHETRRIYGRLSTHSYVAGGRSQTVTTAQGLWAPYAADYEDIATWFGLQAERRSGLTDATQITPLLRLFQRRWWVDVGVSVNREHRGDAFVNLMLLF